MRKKVDSIGAGGDVVCIGEWDVYDLWIGNGVRGYTLSALTALNLAANHK